MNKKRSIINFCEPIECPFCHKPALVIKEKLWNGNYGYYGKYNYYVGCKNSKCRVQPRTKPYNDIYDMTEKWCIDKAIRDWNCR